LPIGPNVAVSMTELIDLLRHRPEVVLMAWGILAAIVLGRRSAARDRATDRYDDPAPRNGPPPAVPEPTHPSVPTRPALDTLPPPPPRPIAAPPPAATPLPSGGLVTITLQRPRSFSGRAHVIDGDTIIVRGTKIRLAGIDAPELDRPYGQTAKWTMVDICKGKEITVELTGEASHDRLVGVCRLPDGLDVAEELVRRGLALDVPFYSNGRYRRFEPPGVRRKLHDREAAWRYRAAPKGPRS
jgi:endonuclease YncB( thermonuclease family)